jgi:serine protease Do
MFRVKVLAGLLIAAGAFAFAQNSAPKAKSVRTYSFNVRSYLGIGVVDLPEERAKALGLKDAQGVEVTSVTEGAPAAIAGIRQGDVILEYNGQRVDGGQQFVRMVHETPVGRKVPLRVWRNGAKQTVSVVIASRQEPFAFSIPNLPEPSNMFLPDIQIPDLPRDMMSWRSPVLGVESEALNTQLAEFFGVKEGVLVRSVIKGSPAETAGLKAGDVIVKINGEAVSSPRNISGYLRRSGKDVTVTIVRNHKELTLNVKVAMLEPAPPLDVPLRPPL